MKAPITEPESPALALKRRRLHNNQAEEGQGEEEERESHAIKPTPMPNMDKFFQPQLPHKRVDTQPFSFEERDKNKPTRETFVEMILRKEKVHCTVTVCMLVGVHDDYEVRIQELGQSYQRCLSCRCPQYTCCLCSTML